MDEEQTTPEEQKKVRACASRMYWLVFAVSMAGLALMFFSLHQGWLPEAAGVVGLFLFAGPPGILLLVTIFCVFRAP